MATSFNTCAASVPGEGEFAILCLDGPTEAAKLLPRKTGYYTFQGSLTTPPCSEEVTWLVLKSPTKIADAQIAAFGKIYPLNARPVQPLNGRTIQATK